MVRLTKNKFLSFLWMLIGGLALFAGSESAVAGICESWQKADTRIRILELARERLWDRQGALTRKIEAQEASGPDPMLMQEIADLEWELKDKRKDIAAKKRELQGTRAVAADYDPEKLQAAVDDARQKLQAAEERFRKIPASDSGSVSVEGAYEKWFGGRDPEEVVPILESDPPSEDPIFRNTMVVEIGRAIGRADYFSRAYIYIDHEIGTRLDRLSRAELVEKERQERRKLKDLAVAFRDLPARTERRDAAIDVTRKRDALAQAERDLASAEDYSQKLSASIQEYGGELAALEQEAASLAKTLEEKKKIRSPLADARAELDGVNAELEKIEKDLRDFKEKKLTLDKDLHRMAWQVKTLLDAAKQSGRMALQTSRDSDAPACREARNSALQTLKEASYWAAQNQSCMDQTLLQRLNAAYQKADAIGCSTRAEQQDALIAVPAVPFKASRDEAEAILRGAGFSGIILFSPYLAPEKPEDANKVIRVTSPPPGQLAAPDTSITVSIFNEVWQDPEAVDAALEEAVSDGGAWDREASQAKVSATSHTPVKPENPTKSADLPSDSQVDRAREVAQAAAAKGSRAKPIVNPQAILDVLSTAARINSSENRSGRSSSSGPTTSGIPDDPLPGVIPSSGSSGSGWTQSGNAGTSGSTGGETGGHAPTPGGGSGDCTIHHTGAGGDTYYVIDMGGRPKGFEIRRVYDPPRSDADRIQCGTHRGAMKKCIQESYRQMGGRVSVHGPFSSRRDAERFAKNRCR